MSHKYNIGFPPKTLIELGKQLQDRHVPVDYCGQYYKRYIEFKAREMGKPLSGCFELTPFCNLDCKMCYVHLTTSQYDQKLLLSSEAWRKIMLQAFKAGMRNATLTGGECLSFPGFVDLYTYLYSLGIHPVVLTNGVLVNKDLITLWKDKTPSRIQVSLYGSSDDSYEKVTGHRVFHIVYDNLIALRDANIPVAISITPNEFMRGDVTPLLETAKVLNIPSSINANLIVPRKNTGREIHDLTIDEYIEVYKTHIEINNGSVEPVNPEDIPEENHEVNIKRGLLCGAGRSSFGVKYDGKLCPCLSLDEICVDILSQGFENAWNVINSEAKNYLLPAECGDCVYRGRCLPCVAMHKNAPIAGHCDTRICERTKKFIAAGLYQEKR